MSHRTSRVSQEELRKQEMIRVARTLPTDRGPAACIDHAVLFGRIAASLKPSTDDLVEAAAVCVTCPLLEICPVAVTKPEG